MLLIENFRRLNIKNSRQLSVTKCKLVRIIIVFIIKMQCRKRKTCILIRKMLTIKIVFLSTSLIHDFTEEAMRITENSDPFLKNHLLKTKTTTVVIKIVFM